MSDESKMCFMTVANHPYQKYVPWFLYFLGRAYPDAKKLVLLDGKMTDKVRDMLALLDGNFEVREDSFYEYEKTDANTIKCLRWLTWEPEFEQYDCMSIGDVDMAIYKETPPYMDQHLAHCEQLGIPYSNFMRPPSAGPRRMGGINVFKPKEWFAAVSPLITKYRLMLHANLIRLPEQGFNEQLLLKLITESSLGEPPENLSETYWPALTTSNHHGTHIRLAEMGGIEGLKGANGYLYHRPQIIAATRTPLFKQLSDLSPVDGWILQQIARAYKNF